MKQEKLLVTDVRRSLHGQKEPTVYVGMRLKKSFYERLLRVAEKQANNVRGVVEQFASTSLPELEKLYGIEPAEPHSQPASGRGKK